MIEPNGFIELTLDPKTTSIPSTLFKIIKFVNSCKSNSKSPSKRIILSLDDFSNPARMAFPFPKLLGKWINVIKEHCCNKLPD